MKKYTFHIAGTHCASCKILVEDTLMDPANSPQEKQDVIKNARVNLKKETVEIETESNKEPSELAKILTSKTEKNGYTVSVEKNVEEKKSDDVIWKAIPIGLALLILFFILQKSGFLNIGVGSKTTPITSFVIGLIASVSSCLAIVGGLVLSLSAKIEQNNDNVSVKKLFILFHSGRLIGFALLGGVLGLIGKAIGINFLFSSILGIIASTVMVILGLNLVGIFKKNVFTLPSNIFSFFRKIEHATWTPIVVGIGTFFLPCGFTQSMQVSALGSGSFLSGMLIMFSFALGTLPMLALLSFGSASFAQSKYAPLFFKSTGIVVLGLGIFALLAGLASLGVISPLFNI